VANEKSSSAITIPDEWLTMSEDEQNAWIEAALSELLQSS
jgi:hypothetical protein